MRHPIWIWRGQWRFDGWQNQLIFPVLFAGSGRPAARRGYAFLELFSPRLDRALVATLPKWQARLPQHFHGGKVGAFCIRTGDPE